MKAFIVQTGLKIHPFGDPIGETPILNRPLKTWQEELFRFRRIEPVFVDSLDGIDKHERDFYLTFDNVFVSPRLFRLFEQRTAHAGGTRALAIRKSAFTEFTRHIQDLREGRDEKGEFLVYRFYRVKDGAFDPSVLAAALPEPIAMQELPVSLGLGTARRLSHDSLRFPVTTRIAIEIQSWYHIWQVNLVAMPVWWTLHARNPLRMIWMLAKLLYGLATSIPDFAVGLATGRPPHLSLSYFGWHALAQANHVGRGARIHPTAVVLGSALGRKVEVGPFAFVAFSVIGDDTKVSAFSQIRNCVVGPESDLIHGSIMNMCVTYPEARICKVQMSLLGRGSNYGGEVRAYDVKLTGPIHIEHNGRLVSTGTNALGICVGHGAALWGRVSIQHGRVIPNHYTIVENQENVIHHVPTDLPTDGPLMSSGGTVVPARGWRTAKRDERG